MNKLMLTKGRAVACLVLMCLFLVQGCKRELLQPNSKNLQNGISVTEAKAYFNKNLKKAFKSQKLMSSGSLNNAITIEDALANKQPIWEKAYEKIISTGKSVKVPIDFGDAVAVVSPKTNAVVPLTSLNYLFMYKDTIQTIHVEWIILDPDSLWLYGDRSRYTGHIIVKDWDGKTIKKLFYAPIGSTNTTSNTKKKLLSSNGVLNSNVGTEDNLDGAVGFCTLWPTGKCPKTGVCSKTCDNCLQVCAKYSCTLFDCSPECDLPSEPGSGGGGGGDGPINPSGPGGGGAYPPDDCGGGGQIPRVPPTNNDPDPTANMVRLPPCIPKPTIRELNVMVNFMGITDVSMQNFLLLHKDIYKTLENYLLQNGDSQKNKEFVNWSAGYLIENSNLKPSITRLENIYQLVKLQNYRPKDREPTSYYWRPKLQEGTWDNYLTESTPLYFYPNGQKIINLAAYNCHYYAFGLENATKVDDEHPKWVIDLSLKGWEEVTGDVKVGDRIVYYQDYKGDKDWTHSGIVIEVSTDGYATKISSKMGTYEIIEHHPRDIPKSYGSNEPTFLLGEKRVVAPSRVYYRKK